MNKRGMNKCGMNKYGLNKYEMNKYGMNKYDILPLVRPTNSRISRSVVGRAAQSVQRLATGWTVRGSNPGGGRDFPHLPSLLYDGYQVFPGGKQRPGPDADPSPPSSAVVMKGQSYTSTPSIGLTDCTEPQCLYKGDLYLSTQNCLCFFPLLHRA